MTLMQSPPLSLSPAGTAPSTSDTRDEVEEPKKGDGLEEDVEWNFMTDHETSGLIGLFNVDNEQVCIRGASFRGSIRRWHVISSPILF